MSKQGIGAKHDGGKLRVGKMISAFATELEEVTAVLNYGGQKYEWDSWKDVPEGRERYFDAFGRHILAMSRGEVFDAESGLRHIAHITTNALFISYLDRVEMEEADEYDTTGLTFREWLLTYNEPPQ